MSKSLSVIKNIVFTANIAGNKLIKVFFFHVSLNSFANEGTAKY